MDDPADGGPVAGSRDPDLDRAVVALGDPRLAPLVDELVRRLSASDRPVVRVQLRDLDAAQRDALADLLRDDRVPAASLRLDVQRLAIALHIDVNEIPGVVERLRGPLGNRARALAEATAARATAAARLGEQAARIDDRLRTWAQRQAVAVDGDLRGHVATVAAALRVLEAADERRPEPLPVVACRVLGDPHAADGVEGVGRALRAALDFLGGGRSARERMLAAGLADDEISTTVATWALPLPDGHPGSGWYDAGEIGVLTIGQLRRHPVARTPLAVTVVENPSVLATARARGVATPLLCLSGYWSHAVRLACDQVVAAGGTLAVHTDFDVGGLSIIGLLLARYGERATPWRMEADDYRRAVAGSTVELDVDRVPDTPWSADLADAMRREGHAAFEEAMLDVLLAPDGAARG